MNVNGNSYQEGRAPRGPQQISNGTREKVSFDPPRVPVFLRPEKIGLEVEGRNGPQFLWLFEGNLIAWFDPPVHAEILACLEVSGASELAITKHVRKGTPPRFEVQAVREESESAEDEPPSAPPLRSQPRAAAPPARPAPPARSAPAPARTHVERSPNGRPPKFHYEEAIEAETAPPSSQLEKALIEAITAAHAASAVAAANGIKFEPTSAQFIELAKILLKLEDQL